MWLIRFVLGKIILFLDWAFQPRALLMRSPDAQKRVDHETQNLTLYQFIACPFCVKVRRHIKRLGLKIEIKDAQNDPVAKKELIEGGKELQVPCLRIQGDGQVRWMYESSDINDFLDARFLTS